MLQALRDDVIIKPVYEKQHSNIIIPQSARKWQQYDGKVLGEVVSVGPKYQYELKPGDKITFTRHEGKKIPYKGELYLKLAARWVLGKVVG